MAAIGNHETNLERSGKPPAMTTRKHQSRPGQPARGQAAARLAADPGAQATVRDQLEDAPVGWAEAQDQLAAALGLSVLLVAGRQPPALVTSNNNSICRAFQSSPEHASLCDPFCGEAHRRAFAAGSAVTLVVF